MEIAFTPAGWRLHPFGDLHLPEKCSRGSLDDPPGLEAAFDRLWGDERAGIEDFNFQADADLLLQLAGDAAFQCLALFLGQRRDSSSLCPPTFAFPDGLT